MPINLEKAITNNNDSLLVSSAEPLATMLNCQIGSITANIVSDQTILSLLGTGEANATERLLISGAITHLEADRAALIAIAERVGIPIRAHGHALSEP